MRRRDRPATMEDVAARAGVSRALVSIVYRDAPGASDATRARVLQAGADLGYRPDHRARLLGRQRTRLLGVTFDVPHSFHGDLIEALYSAAEPTGYDLALSAVAPSRDESRAVQSLLEYRCEALILLGPQLRPSAIAELGAIQPTIVVARKVRAAGVDVVRTDDADGLRQAVEHLVRLGHRDIVHVDGGTAPGAAERRAGYRNAMRRAGLIPRIIRGGAGEEDGAAAARRVLADSAGTTAAAVFNDRSAMGFLDVIRGAGQRVPDDISVIGYDNSSIARMAHVNLTTIAQNARQLAIVAIEQAVRRLSGAPPSTEKIVAPTLMSRCTTGAAPAESTDLTGG
ncbi:MAG TPA: LacI family DNA-binding transcriptional regulator [Kribbella sp.]|nr:LacI family DNA-binding transcriptional regulator [Kribbella sp.]